LEHTPVLDRTAVIVRGICGALLGLGLAVYVWIRSDGLGMWASVFLFVAAVIGCARRFFPVRRASTAFLGSRLPRADIDDRPLLLRVVGCQPVR